MLQSTMVLPVQDRTIEKEDTAETILIQFFSKSTLDLSQYLRIFPQHHSNVLPNLNGKQKKKTHHNRDISR